MQSRLRTLYEELGSEARVIEIVQALYQVFAQDPMIGFFFAGKDLAVIARHQSQFILRAMGARSSYAGKPPAHAHDQLPPILAGHFDRRITLLGEVLPKLGLSAVATKTWIDFESSFRSAIVSE